MSQKLLLQWITMKQKSPAFLVIVGARSEELAIAISDVFRASFMDVEPLTTFNLTSESSRVELHNQISRGKTYSYGVVFLDTSVDT